jgi:hypothetical protein
MYGQISNKGSGHRRSADGFGERARSYAAMGVRLELSFFGAAASAFLTA